MAHSVPHHKNERERSVNPFLTANLDNLRAIHQDHHMMIKLVALFGKHDANNITTTSKE